MAGSTTTLTMILNADDKASSKMDLLASKLQNVSTKYDLQTRAAEQLRNKMDSLNSQIAANGAATAKEAAEASRLQLQYDKLTLAMRNTEQQGRGVVASMQAQSSGADKAGGSISGLVGKMGTLAAGYVGIQSIQAAVEWGKQGAAIQGVTDSFDKLAVSVGTTGPVLLSEMQKASKGTISNAELMAKANAAVLLGGQDLAAKLPQMLEIAGASAKAMGTDVNTAFDSLVTGLARGSVEIIDNLGITVDAAGAYQRYADSIGVSVNELTKSQKTQAFQNEVMTQGMATVERLGTSTLTAAEKIAQADTQIKNFTDNLKVLAGASIGNLLTFINQDQLMAQTIAEGTAQIIERGGAYSDYAARMDAVGQGAIKLSEAEYIAAAALIANGAAAEQAITSAQGLGAANETLQGALFKVRDGAFASSEAQEALTEKVLTLGATTPAAAAAIAALTDELSNGGPVEDFAAAIENLIINEEFATSTSYGYADAQIAANDAIAAAIDPATAQADATLAQADAFLYLTGLTYEQADAQFAENMQAVDAAAFQRDLANAALAASNSALGGAAASWQLASAYGIEIGMVQKLIANTVMLNKTRTGAMGADVGGAAAGGIPKAAAMAPYRAERAARAEAARATRSGGGSGGGGGRPRKEGKSEAVKQAERDAKDLQAIEGKIDKASRDYQTKREAAEKAHVEKLAAINEDFRAKQLAAEQKFNSDKFDQQVNFKNGLIDSDQDLWNDANKAERGYWDESQAMAQAGHAQQAAEYYAAGVELANLVAQNAQGIRDLREEIAASEDEAERARLEQRLARMQEINAQEEQLARDKVEAVKNGGDQIEAERQDAIEQENADYSNAQDSLKASFADTLDEIQRSYSDMSAGVRQIADAFIAAAAAATAAVNSIPSAAASGGESGAESSGDPPPEARASGGPVRRGTTYLVGEEGRELFTPTQNGFITNAAATAQLGRSSATASMGSSSSITNAPSYTVSVDMRGASGGAGDETRLRAAVRDELQKFNNQVGRKATNSGRS